MAQSHSPPWLSQARQLFHTQGAVPGGLVAEPILRSWRRCAERGFDMRGARRAELMTQAELREARERNEALRRLAAPAMSALQRQAGASGGLVILCDAQGLVLDTEGDAGFAQRASRVALMPGASWDEAAAGTNAIGTALVEGRAIAVHGAEHYFEPNRILTCAAVPIMDGAGRPLGVLDLSSQAGAARPDVLACVQAAADRVEHRLFLDAHSECAVLALHARPAGLGAPGEALLAFHDGLLVAANRIALQALDLPPTALGVYRYGDLFEGDLARCPVSGGRLRAHRGAVFHARLRWPSERAPAPPREPAAPPAAPRNGMPLASFDAPALEALARAVHLCDAGVSILLQGETGVGKEVFARALHARSRRAQGPFVAVNCAALPESLIESELFGYEDGAFTGARRQGNKGLLRQAHGGMLFLDEIGDMPLALQARLLRVLQTREVSPLGAARPVAVDFALVCATHRPLAQGSPDAPVRSDLYFRIAEYTVELPPLRTRADLRGLLRQWWESLHGGPGPAPALPPDIEDLLAAYRWPGNYRQMAAVLRTLRVLAGPGGAATRDMLPAELRAAPPPAAPNLKEMEASAIRQALQAHGGNVSAAARALGVHRSTLYRRAAALGLARER
ncbi:sigma-54-dependent Fis family transcriptional regulator [Achromobacter sp. Marseille-Q4962]|uniref:sigma-54-dependent Fis family transcriptional regulator n=1 Tax=Achromobacter sp. Marseille-Q4962 TaxID=2942202 RepID=UPI0020730C72|nr:sigma-54-dependent Fis family transcriptional regulator [Achromobacter sp. Marseille-Q4962]